MDNYHPICKISSVLHTDMHTQCYNQKQIKGELISLY